MCRYRVDITRTAHAETNLQIVFVLDATAQSPEQKGNRAKCMEGRTRMNKLERKQASVGIYQMMGVLALYISECKNYSEHHSAWLVKPFPM